MPIPTFPESVIIIFVSSGFTELPELKLPEFLNSISPPTPVPVPLPEAIVKSFPLILVPDTSLTFNLPLSLVPKEILSVFSVLLLKKRFELSTSFPVESTKTTLSFVKLSVFSELTCIL